MTPIEFADRDIEVDNAEKWETIAQLGGSRVGFKPIEIKAIYIFGLLDDIFQSVQFLLQAEDAWPEKYLPAYSLFSSGVDLFGRCLTGNKTLNTNENLRVGFWFLLHPSTDPLPSSLPKTQMRKAIVETPHSRYTIEDLIALRNYAAHGQAEEHNLPSLDNQLLSMFPDHLGGALETYWYGLLSNAQFCTRLASALVDPFADRSQPLTKILKYFAGGSAAGDLFYRLDWKV